MATFTNNTLEKLQNGFSFLFIIISIVLIAISTWLWVSLKKYEYIFSLQSYNFWILPPAILMLAILLISAAIISFIGTYTKNYEHLYMFSLVAFIGLFILVISVVIICIYKEKIGKSITTNMESSMSKISNDRTNIAWEDIQELLQCCGTSNYTDWIAKNTTLPDSCCIANLKKSGNCNTTDLAEINKTGCAVKFKEWMDIKVPQYVFGIAAIFTLCALFNSYELGKRMKSNEYVF